uniref:SRPBCC domain-containing protein n=1 Tax=Pedobacter schmidteae TaxID=2201271 RepID=UPI000EB58A4E|nr:SRPBCC domain-containing protein [Pedobacter schmidteae]
MEKLKFNILINASSEKVWKTLWEDETYRQWTTAFSEESSAHTDWKKGSKILFLDGKGQGMVSRVAENIPNEYMSIEHLGFVKDGVEDLTSEEVKAWAGAHENYRLKNINGATEVAIDMDITDEYKEMFTEMWPKALTNLKSLAEQ